MKHMQQSKSKKHETTTTLHIESVLTSGISGKVAFQCGTHLTRKDRMNRRQDKYAKQEKRNQISGE